MKLHEIKRPFGAKKRKKLVGRGNSSGHGKTSTRGQKGQKSRSNFELPANFEGGQTPLVRRIPKRGFRIRIKKEYQLVNLFQLNQFDNNSNVGPKEFEEASIIRSKNRLVKILGSGTLLKTISVKANAFSLTAKERIEKLGGKVEII